MPYLDFSYYKPGKIGKAKARASLGYNKREKATEKAPRILFTNGSEPMTAEEALAQINTAPKNTYFFKMIFSPDVKTENVGKKLDLWAITDALNSYLENKLNRKITYIGVAHNNTDNPHVHAIFLVQRRGREMLITEKDIEIMKELATGKSLEQLAFRERLAAREQERQRERAQAEYHQPLIGMAGGKVRQAREPRVRREQQAKPSLTITTCPGCHVTSQVKILSRNFLECLNCDRVFPREMSARKEAGWGRSR